MLGHPQKSAFGPSRDPQVSVDVSSTRDPKGAFPARGLLRGARLQPRKLLREQREPGIMEVTESWSWRGAAVAGGRMGVLRWRSGQRVDHSKGNTGPLGAMLLQGGMEKPGCLQKQGKGKRSPAALEGRARGAVSNPEGVREFRVSLWFVLPSSSSRFQRVGGIFVRPHQQHEAGVGLAERAGTALPRSINTALLRRCLDRKQPENRRKLPTLKGTGSPCWERRENRLPKYSNVPRKLL